jgi:hypothetical protein
MPPPRLIPEFRKAKLPKLGAPPRRSTQSVEPQSSLILAIFMKKIVKKPKNLLTYPIKYDKLEPVEWLCFTILFFGGFFMKKIDSIFLENSYAGLQTAGNHVPSKRRNLNFFGVFAVVALMFMATGCDFIYDMLGGDSDDEPLTVEPTAKPVDTDVAVTGGEVSRDGNYEIHVFKEPGEWTLEFSDERDNLLADIFIVAGGGGSGGQSQKDNDFPGGGGAGGLLYEAERVLVLKDSVLTVTVGAGGAGGIGTEGSAGNDGGASSLVANITVPGGGGGGGWNSIHGRPGGSGGGGSGANGTGRGTGGVSQKIENMKGFPGGMGYAFNNTSSKDCGGGGGGAGGAGVNASDGIGGAGGSPWKVPDTWAWIKTATGTSAFSAGGQGGGNTGSVKPVHGANYGDGGSITGRGATSLGGAGHSGVVVIRFERKQAEQAAE